MSGVSLSMFPDRATQLNGSRIATRFGDRERTWAALAQEAARLAGELARAGVRPGNRIAMLAANSDRCSVDPLLRWHVFDVPQRQQVADVHQHHQPDHLGRAIEPAKWAWR